METLTSQKKASVCFKALQHFVLVLETVSDSLKEQLTKNC